MIGRAEYELQRRKLAFRGKFREEIEEKIRNAGLDLGELRLVKAKYRDPVSLETWSGRGARPPLWVKRIMAERGWTLEEFKRSGEYDV